MNPIERRIAEVMNRLITADGVIPAFVAEQVVASCLHTTATCNTSVTMRHTPSAASMRNMASV